MITVQSSAETRVFLVWWKTDRQTETKWWWNALQLAIRSERVCRWNEWKLLVLLLGLIPSFT